MGHFGQYFPKDDSEHDLSKDTSINLTNLRLHSQFVTGPRFNYKIKNKYHLYFIYRL